MNIVDYSIVLVYLLGILAVGCYFVRKQHSTEDFFVAGRSISWFPIAASLSISLVSGLSLLGMPGYSYQYVPLYLLGPFVTIPSILIIALLIVPLLYRLKLVTVYTYLERRYNLTVRCIGSVFFMLVRGMYLAAVICASAVAISLMANIPFWVCVLLIGLVSALYTTLGGMKAVIWTDVFQFFVLVGVLIVILFALLRGIPGGAAQALEIARQGEKMTLFNRLLDPRLDNSALFLTISFFFSRLSDFGSDQVSLQRYFSGKSKMHAVASTWSLSLILIPMNFILVAIGILLFAYYQINPQQITSNILADSGRILPHFVVQVLPIGLPGLFVACILSGTMSTVDSVLNCLSAVYTTDFHQRFINKNASQQQYLKISRVVTIVAGSVGTGLAFLVRHALKHVWQMGFVCIGLFGGPLLAIFLLGFFTKRVGSIAAIIGAACGLIAAIISTFVLRWSSVLVLPVGCLTAMIASFSLSFIGARAIDVDLTGLTIWTKTRTGIASATKT